MTAQTAGHVRPDVPYRVEGEMHVDTAVIRGWCWCPERPNDRLRVSLYVDGQVLGTSVASRLWLELVRDGICDGYHGFIIPLPFESSSSRLLELREYTTGKVFARKVPEKLANLDLIRTRLNSIDAELDLLEIKLGHPAHEARLALVSGALQGAGQILSARSMSARSPRVREVQWGLTGPQLPCGFRLPQVSAPGYSLIFDGVEANRLTLQCIVSLAPFLRHYGVQIIVADDGLGPASSALFNIVGLAYSYSRAPTAAARHNEAARLARGDLLVFLEPGDAILPSLIEMISHESIAGGLLLGSTVLAAAIAAGVEANFAQVSSITQQARLRLSTPRSIFADLGGFDEAMDDGVCLPEVDFALRAVGRGCDVHACLDPRPAAKRPHQDATGARARFLARWAG